MKRTQSFDVKNFIVHFDSVFTKPDVSKEFQNFLKSEFNEEPWLFMMEVKKQNSEEIQKDKKILIETTLKIIEEFLLDGSTKEINISGRSKKSIVETYELYKTKETEEWLFDEPSDKIFESIFKIVKSEMYHDPWRRFLRTKPCELLMIKYQQDSTVCSPQIIENFMFNDEYFHHPYLFISDFKFAASLFEDNFHWEVRKKIFL